MQQTESSSLDRIVEISSLLGLVVLWIAVFVNYSKLPDSVPIHFDISGRPDNFGEKDSAFLMPLVASVIFVFLWFKRKSAVSLLKSESTSSNNAVGSGRQYIYFNFFLVLFFALLELKTFQIAAGKAEGLGVWFLPLSVGLLLVLFLYFKIKAFKGN